MTLDCGSWYKFTFPATVSASNLIFNDGTLQTADLSTTTAMRFYDGACLRAEPTNRCPKSMTVYFKPPRTWSTAPRIHFWNAVPAGNIANTTWPGMTMVSDVNGFFIYTIVGPTSVNGVINNGNNVSGNQTVDLLNKTNNYSFTYGGAARLTNIEDNEFDFVSVFPNPVIDLLQISSNRVVLNYRITTLQIVVLKEGQPIDNKVDVSHLTSGLYFLQLTLKNGEEQIKRIVKK